MKPKPTRKMLKARRMVRDGMAVREAAETCGVITANLATWASYHGLTRKDGIVKPLKLTAAEFHLKYALIRYRRRARSAVVAAGLPILKVYVDWAYDLILANKYKHDRAVLKAVRQQFSGSIVRPAALQGHEVRA